MALTSKPVLKTLLNISSTDTSQDEVLDVVANAADAAVKSYLRRGRARGAFASWPEAGTETTYYMSGQAAPSLVLPLGPIRSIGSIYLDSRGYYGKATGAFPSTSLLTEGVDYVVDWDEGGSSSSSGIVWRLASNAANAGFSLFDDGGGFGGWAPSFGAWAQASGSLAMSGRRAALWPAGRGNVKLGTIAYGYTGVPDDLEYAAAMYAVVLYQGRERGGPLSAESLGSLSFTLLNSPGSGSMPALGEIRQILAPYRSDISF